MTIRATPSPIPEEVELGMGPDEMGDPVLGGMEGLRPLTCSKRHYLLDEWALGYDIPSCLRESRAAAAAAAAHGRSIGSSR